MHNKQVQYKAVFSSVISEYDETASIIFDSYADLTTQEETHFESRFGETTTTIVGELLSLWKSLQPFLAGTADVAGIISLILTVRQSTKSKEIDKVLADIVQKIEELEALERDTDSSS